MRALLGNCMGTLPLQFQYTLFGYSCQYAFAVKLLRFCKQRKFWNNAQKGRAVFVQQYKSPRGFPEGKLV